METTLHINDYISFINHEHEEITKTDRRIDSCKNFWQLNSLLLSCFKDLIDKFVLIRLKNIFELKY